MFSANVSSDLLGSFLEGLPSAFFVTEAGKIIFANQRFAEWMDVPYDTLPGRPEREVIPAELRQNLAASTPPTGAVTSEERSVVFPDGIARWLVIRTFPVPHGDGSGVGNATVMTDRTEVRRIQEQLWQAQKMEAVGQLTGGVAHDFNNLLTVVLGNLEFASDLLADNPQVLRHLQVAQRAAERGARLIQRLLAFSGQQQLQATATDLNKLVREVTEFARRTLPESIKVRTELSGENRYAVVDPAQLESAVLNLIVNARDAMQSGGELLLRTDSVCLSSSPGSNDPPLPSGEYAVIAVRDTGIGMPPEVVRRIFEPFFTTKAKGKGTGLGLCMVQGFAKQSGGDVRLVTAPGQGTEVALYLPLASGDVQADRHAQAGDDNAPSGDCAVLVVEDDPDVRRYVTETLQRLRFRIFEAESGDEAIAQLRRDTTFDLLFTDVVLPGSIDGVRLAQVARLLHPNIRVLLGSGYTDHALDAEVASSKEIEVIRKPYSREHILRIVRDVLGGRNETTEYGRRRDRVAV